MANEAKWADPSDDYDFWQQINLRRVDNTRSAGVWWQMDICFLKGEMLLRVV